MALLDGQLDGKVDATYTLTITPVLRGSGEVPQSMQLVASTAL